jgi:hypothetical protein
MKKKIESTSLALFIFIALIQVFNVSIHIAMNQIEPIRILASAVVLIGLIATRLTAQKRSVWILGLSGVIYLSLNAIFIVEDGVLNPVSGEPRVLLMAIALATTLPQILYGRSLIVKGQRE